VEAVEAVAVEAVAAAAVQPMSAAAADILAVGGAAAVVGVEAAAAAAAAWACGLEAGVAAVEATGRMAALQRPARGLPRLLRLSRPVEKAWYLLTSCATEGDPPPAPTTRQRRGRILFCALPASN
jgi:hypothetical protein